MDRTSFLNRLGRRPRIIRDALEQRLNDPRLGVVEALERARVQHISIEWTAVPNGRTDKPDARVLPHELGLDPAGLDATVFRSSECAFLGIDIDKRRGSLASGDDPPEVQAQARALGLSARPYLRDLQIECRNGRIRLYGDVGAREREAPQEAAPSEVVDTLEALVLRALTALDLGVARGRRPEPESPAP